MRRQFREVCRGTCLEVWRADVLGKGGVLVLYDPAKRTEEHKNLGSGPGAEKRPPDRV